MLNTELMRERSRLLQTIDRLENSLTATEQRTQARLDSTVASIDRLLQRLSDVEYSLSLESHLPD